MRLPQFEYDEPQSIKDACEVLTAFGEAAKPLAGGTDLMVNMKKRVVQPSRVLSLKKLKDCRRIEQSGGTIVIGACVLVAELIQNRIIAERLPALQAGAQALGSPLIRNLATIGGNICSARPAADLPPSLLVYGARVVLHSEQGPRTVPLSDFFTGPGQTVMRADELLTAIELEAPPAGSGAGYLNLGIRQVQDIDVINGAAYLALNPGDGTIDTARIALGAVAPTPIRSPRAEQTLQGQKPSPELFVQAGQAAQNDCAPITDFRGGAAYRKAMTAVVVRRVLETALKQCEQ